MTVSSWRVPSVCFALAFLVAIVAQIPVGPLAQVLAKRLDVVAAESAGTIWGGVMSDVELSGVPVGEVNYRLSPFGLRFEWATSESNIRSQGVANLNLDGSATLSGVTLTAFLDRLLTSLSISGRLDASMNSATVQDGVCRTADGTITVRGTLGILDRPRVDLSGSLVCDNSVFVALLTGSLGPYATDVDMRSADPRRADVLVVLSDVPEDVGNVLTTFGFQGRNGKYELGQSLRLN